LVHSMLCVREAHSRHPLSARPFAGPYQQTQHSQGFRRHARIFGRSPARTCGVGGDLLAAGAAASRTSHAEASIPPISVASSAEMTITARQRVSCHTQAVRLGGFAAWGCASGHPQASPCYAWVWHQSVPNKVAKHVRPFSVPPSIAYSQAERSSQTVSSVSLAAPSFA
jgi:hypothetical protein